MSVIVERDKGIFLGFQAEILNTDVETAWAERYHVSNPAYAWILGKYVTSGEPNLNRHLFPLEDLQGSVASLAHAPLNINHNPRRVVGTFAAGELVYPEGGKVKPFMEALSLAWKHYFRDEFREIEAAHADGTLFYSMECLPRSITCAGNTGCGAEFPYMGPQSPLYCQHLNEFSLKQINKPHFTGGALVIPPDKPAWRKADISELSKLIERRQDEAERVYATVADELPHLEPRDWETIMQMLLVAAK